MRGGSAEGSAEGGAAAGAAGAAPSKRRRAPPVLSPWAMEAVAVVQARLDTWACYLAAMGLSLYQKA